MSASLGLKIGVGSIAGITAICSILLFVDKFYKSTKSFISTSKSIAKISESKKTEKVQSKPKNESPEKDPSSINKDNKTDTQGQPENTPNNNNSGGEQ